MSNIKEIVSRIYSINSTQQITKTMKLVASAKFIKAQHRLLQFRTYALHLSTIMNRELVNTDCSSLQPYIRSSKVQKVLLVVMSADKGLCGSFNANVIKKTEAYLKENSGLTTEQIDLLVIGKKAYAYFQKKDYHLITTYQSISAKLQFEAVSQAAHWMINAFVTQRYDRIAFIYNLFGNAATQFVQVEPFLPLVHPLPIKSDYHDHYIYEPSQVKLVETLVPLSLSIQLYKALLESNASEHGARMTTMSKASDNADALLKTLRITYNKTRQASITNEILEIAAGAEALRHSS